MGPLSVTRSHSECSVATAVAVSWQPECAPPETVPPRMDSTAGPPFPGRSGPKRAVDCSGSARLRRLGGRRWAGSIGSRTSCPVWGRLPRKRVSQPHGSRGLRSPYSDCAPHHKEPSAEEDYGQQEQDAHQHFAAQPGVVCLLHRADNGVPRGGIEPPTPRFSVVCSTN